MIHKIWAKVKIMKKTILLIFVAATLICMDLWAQGPRKGMDPSRMLHREKTMILEELDGLTDQQKQELSKLYEDLSQRVDKQIATAEADFRKQRADFREEKETALKSILNEEQADQYHELVERRKRRFQQMKRDKRH